VYPSPTEVIGRTFITALLLAESAERAGAAVLEGIRAMERSEISVEALLQGTLSASIAARIPGRQVENQADALSLLPLKLHRALPLSPDRRRCFRPACPCRPVTPRSARIAADRRSTRSMNLHISRSERLHGCRKWRCHDGERSRLILGHTETKFAQEIMN